MTRALRRHALLSLGLLLVARSLLAQVSVGVSGSQERTTYHFEAPSSYDTPQLVPHFFEQHYELDNVWVEAAIAHRRVVPGVTRLAVTAVRQRLATDYDTFYNPGGVTWVSGTTGDARVHSIRVEHELAIGRRGPIAWTGGYRLQLDRASFLDGYRTDVRNGVLVSAQTVTSPEYTSAQRHEIFFTGSREHPIGHGWLLALRATGSPATLSRLAIRLPEKYPNQTLVYNAAGLSATVRVELGRSVSRLPFSVHLESGQTWSYRSTARASRRALALGVTFGRSPS